MTNYTSKTPPRFLILRNFLISAIAGILFGCFLFPTTTALQKIFNHDGYSTLSIDGWLQSTLASPFLIVFALPLLLPLIFIGCMIGIIFERSIVKHLGTWCLAGPIAVWLTTLAILNLSGAYDEPLTEFLRSIKDPGNFLFLIGPSFSSFIFFKLGKVTRW